MTLRTIIKLTESCGPLIARFMLDIFFKFASLVNSVTGKLDKGMLIALTQSYYKALWFTKSFCAKYWKNLFAFCDDILKAISYSSKPLMLSR